jgi:lipid II:glycine glycyltransferase (peptidoglycan interpeptide bridge formation enzyme)
MLVTYPEKIQSSLSYDVKTSTSEHDTEWDDFVASVPQGRQPQSSQWANIKLDHGWQGFRLIVSHLGTVVGGAQVLIRNVSRLGQIGIVAHGPVIHPYEPALVSLIIDELIHVCRQHGIACLIVQPPPGEEYMEAELLHHRFYLSPAPIAPIANVVLDLSLDLKDLLAGMRRQKRQNLRRAEDIGVQVRLGTRDDLHIFYEFHCATARRQGFSPYSEFYHQKMWDRLMPDNGIQIFIGNDQGRDTSAMIVTTYGNRVYSKFSGWTGENSSHHTNEAVDWAAIQWAKAAGYHYFDFEGFDRRDAQIIQATHKAPSQWHNSSSFYKYCFGGDVLIYPLAYHYIFNPALRWMTNSIVLPLVTSDSPLKRLPVMRDLTVGLIQRAANQQRVHD